MIPHETMTMVEEEYKDRIDQMRRLLSVEESRVEQLEAAIRTHREVQWGDPAKSCPVLDDIDAALYAVLREEAHPDET